MVQMHTTNYEICCSSSIYFKYFTFFPYKKHSLTSLHIVS